MMHKSKIYFSYSFRWKLFIITLFFFVPVCKFDLNFLLKYHNLNKGLLAAVSAENHDFIDWFGLKGTTNLV